MSPRRTKAQIAADEESTRAARLQPIEAPPVRVPVASQLTVTEERRERELEEVLDQIGTDGRVRVWNIIEGKPEYAGEMAMEGFSLETLMDVFGGGEKTLAFYQGRERVDSVRVALDRSVPPRNPRVKSLPPGATPAQAPGQDLSVANLMLTGMSAIMKASAESSTLMMNMMAEMAKSRTPDRDPLDAVSKAVELIKATTPPPAPAPGLDVSKAFELFEKGMNVASKLGGGGDEDGTTSIIKEGIGAVGRMAEAIIATRQQQPPPPATDPHQLELAPVPNPAPVSGNGVTSSVPSVARPMQPTRAWHRAVLPHYDDLKMAARFLSGDSAAIELLRRIPEPTPGEPDVLDDLMDDLEDEAAPGFVARVSVAFPELVLSPEWVALFHETLKANMEEEGEEEDPKPPGVAGHIAPG